MTNKTAAPIGYAIPDGRLTLGCFMLVAASPASGLASLVLLLVGIRSGYVPSVAVMAAVLFAAMGLASGLLAVRAGLPRNISRSGACLGCLGLLLAWPSMMLIHARANAWERFYCA